MTATRLRETAERLETQCIQLRLWTEGTYAPTYACDGCKAAARELRELAQEMERANVPTHQ